MYLERERWRITTIFLKFLSICFCDSTQASLLQWTAMLLHVASITDAGMTTIHNSNKKDHVVEDFFNCVQLLVWWAHFLLLALVHAPQGRSRANTPVVSTMLVSSAP